LTSSESQKYREERKTCWWSRKN